MQVTRYRGGLRIEPSSGDAGRAEIADLKVQVDGLIFDWSTQSFLVPKHQVNQAILWATCAGADVSHLAAARRETPLGEFVGQHEVVAQLGVVVRGALQRGIAPHILLEGSPGLGKTTLARITAHLLGKPLTLTTGPYLRRVDDLAGVLAACGEGALFIDEVHRMRPAVEEALYEAMDSFTLSVISKSGPKTFALRPFSLVAATSRPGDLTNAFLSRFGWRAQLRPYTLEELGKVIAGRAFADPPEALEAVAGRAKGIPRIAIQLAERVADAALLQGVPITADLATATMELFGIGELGLDRLDIAILQTLAITFKGRPVGRSGLAQAVDVDLATYDEHEGFLARQGLVRRTKQGRQATEATYDYLDISVDRNEGI